MTRLLEALVDLAALGLFLAAMALWAGYLSGV